jgi:catecholate siderophore receptor
MRVSPSLVALVAVAVAAAGLATPAAAQATARGHTPSQRMDTVRVRADAADGRRYLTRTSRSSTRTSTPLRLTPQSVTVIPRAQIADQAMQSMADVVRYIPGITMGQGEGHRDAPTMRGNSSTADFYVNGVRDDAQYLRDLYNVQSVEALKGANALAFGRGGGGGVINRVMREASWGRVGEVSLTAGAFGQTRGSLDVGRVLLPGAAVRLTGMAERAGSYRQHLEVQRMGVNPTAAFLVGATTLRLGAEHFQDVRGVDRGLPSLAGLPLAGATRTIFGDPSLNHTRAYVRSASASIEHGRDERVSFRSQLSFTDYDKSYSNTVPGSIAADQRTLALSAYRADVARRNLFSQSDLVVRAATGVVRHTMLAGVELGRQHTDNYRETGYFGGNTTSARLPLDAPTAPAAVTFRQGATDANNAARALVTAGYLQVETALGPRLQTIVGGRWDRFALAVDDHRTQERRARTDVMFSPRAGIVFSPSATLSAYGSLGISSLPASGDQFASLDASSETLAPERFTNRELGIKWDARPSLAVTVALFQLDRTNTRAPDPSTPGRLVQTGAQRSTGAELGMVGNVSARWQLSGGWSMQRAEIRRTTSAAPAGATVPLVPYQALSLWNRVRLLRRMSVALGAVHQGRMYASIDNRVTLPAFTRWDAAIYLDVTRQVRLQANVENLLDAEYFPTAHNNNNIQPGAPRLLRLTLQALR